MVYATLLEYEHAMHCCCYTPPYILPRYYIAAHITYALPASTLLFAATTTAGDISLLPSAFIIRMTWLLSLEYLRLLQEHYYYIFTPAGIGCRHLPAIAAITYGCHLYVGLMRAIITGCRRDALLPYLYGEVSYWILLLRFTICSHCLAAFSIGHHYFIFLTPPLLLYAITPYITPFGFLPLFAIINITIITPLYAT